MNNDRINKWAEEFGMNVIIKYKFLFFAGIVLLVVLSLLGMKRLVTDTSNESFFPKGDEMIVQNDRFKEIFGNEEFVFVFIEADNVFDHDTLEYVRQDKNVAVLHSFSKAYSLAGLRLGYAIAPPEIARYLSRARESFHLNQMVFVAGLAALRDHEHLEKTIELTLSGRAWLTEQLAGLGMQLWPSQSNFILFKPLFPPPIVSERLLQRGVIVRPMTQFYLPTHLRVTVGLTEENERFIVALQESLTELEAEGASKEVAEEESGGEFKF